MYYNLGQGHITRGAACGSFGEQAKSGGEAQGGVETTDAGQGVQRV
jgi:hypothetical protein